MSKINVKEILNKISEETVFAEYEDTKSIGKILVGLESIEEWLKETKKEKTLQVVDKMKTMLEEIILDDCENPEDTFNLVVRTISSLQKIINENIEEDEVDFPSEYRLTGTSDSTFSIDLPSNVDENIFSDFLSSLENVIDSIEELMLSLEKEYDEAKMMELKRILHSLKGESGIMTLRDIESLCHNLEDWIEDNKDNLLPDVFLMANDWLRQKIKYIQGSAEEPKEITSFIKSMEKILKGESPNDDIKGESGEKSEIPKNKIIEGDDTSNLDEVVSNRIGTLPENVDKEIFSDFISVQNSVLENLENAVMQLEKDHSEEYLDEINRILHTLKGESSLMGLNDIRDICHETEEIIKDIPVESSIDFLYRLKDWFVNYFDYYKGDSTELPSTAEITNILKKLSSEGSLSIDIPDDLIEDNVPKKTIPEKTSVQVEVPEESDEESDEEPEDLDDVELVVDFIEEGFEHLETASNELLKLENNESDPECINSIFRSFHTIKGVAGFMNLTDIRILAHNAEDLLDNVRKDEIDLTDDVLEVVFQSVDKLKELLEALAISAKDGKQPPKNNTIQILITKIKNVLSGNSDQPIPTVVEKQSKSQKTEEPTVKQKAQTSKAQTSKAQTTQNSSSKPQPQSQKGIKVKENIKVDAKRLDHLIDFIGELAIAESMVTQSYELKQVASPELIKKMKRLDKITKEIQSIGMSLRMVTVKSTFQKMARLVRDLSKKSGKLVNFTIHGEDTELDKNVVESIGDPLVHMMRNSVDHGIEPNSDDRVKAGKERTGNVSLSAYHQGGNIIIEIKDDGRGLDKEVLLNKAIEKGIIESGKNMTDEEIFNLIFAAGFSTAKKITDVSGRGVGMDVVRRNIEAMRGHVKIASEKGKGSVFSIILPLTLAIIDGMVIRVGSERFIIPTLTVVTSTKVSDEEYFTAVNKGEMIMFQNELIPISRIGDIFNITGSVSNVTDGVIVIVESSGKKIGLLINELLGQQQIVIKSLKGSMKGITGISGGAIMADGEISLILDIGGLMKLSGNK